MKKIHPWRVWNPQFKTDKTNLDYYAFIREPRKNIKNKSRMANERDKV
jgi:hypothetical protein